MTVYDLQSYLLIIILFSPQYILQHLHKTALQLFKGKNKQMVYPAISSHFLTGCTESSLYIYSCSRAVVAWVWVTDTQQLTAYLIWWMSQPTYVWKPITSSCERQLSHILDSDHAWTSSAQNLKLSVQLFTPHMLSAHPDHTMGTWPSNNLFVYSTPSVACSHSSCLSYTQTLKLAQPTQTHSQYLPG